MRFSVITPSFRNSDWLKLCISSVADQGFSVQHIVQDSCSDDGTQEWLPQDSRVQAFIEKDQGMYDAVNRGLRRATGDILSYLNCDEQYLPGTLTAVADFFEKNPNVDMVFGDFVAVNPQGDYLFHRKLLPPLLYHTWVVHLAAFTCSMFFRRRVLDAGFFNPDYCVAGDAEWMVRVLRRGVRTAVLRRFTSTFTMTGKNLGATTGSIQEGARLAALAPAWARHSKPLIVLHHRLRRWWGGIYQQTPFSYSLYTRQNPAARVTHLVSNPNSTWKF